MKKAGFGAYTYVMSEKRPFMLFLCLSVALLPLSAYASDQIDSSGPFPAIPVETIQEASGEVTPPLLPEQPFNENTNPLSPAEEEPIFSEEELIAMSYATTNGAAEFLTEKFGDIGKVAAQFYEKHNEEALLIPFLRLILSDKDITRYIEEGQFANEDGASYASLFLQVFINILAMTEGLGMDILDEHGNLNVSITAYKKEGDSLVYEAGAIPSSDQDAGLMLFSKGFNKLIFITVPPQFVNQQESGQVSLQDQNGLEVGLPLMLRSSLGDVTYPSSTSASEGQPEQTGGMIEEIWRQFKDTFRHYFDSFVSSFRGNAFVRSDEDQVTTDVKESSDSDEIEYKQLKNQASGVVVSALVIKEILLFDMRNSVEREALGLEDEKQKELLLTEIPSGLEQSMKILDYVILDVSLAKEYVKRHPEGFNPFWQYLFLKQSQKNQMQESYREKYTKMVEIYNKAKKGEGQIYYRGKILEIPILPMPDDNGGVYALISPQPTSPQSE